MNIIRRDMSPLSTYRPMSIDDPFSRLVGDMLEDFFTPFSALPTRGIGSAGSDVVNPRINLMETDHSYEIEAELPGVRKEDVKVAIDDRRVSIEGEVKRESAQEEGGNIVYAERSSRKFSRSFTLPTEIDDAGAQAKLENGILMLTLPKHPASQKKQLTIN